MREFQPNDYRKRVLATVQARGGIGQSDPFEVYDIPLDEAEGLADSDVAARLYQVWAFWQKSRDHPKYRGLVLALLAAHADVGPELVDPQRRGRLADQVRRDRDNRDGQRFADIDAAVARLVQRFGGLPEDKLAGLRRLAAERGIDPDAFALRVRRHRILPAGSRADRERPVIAADLLRQVRADLDELGRLVGDTPPTSLFALLGVLPDASREQIREVRDTFTVRNRERRPDRQRALIDDLLAAVTALLVDGDPALYLDALAADITERLRPVVAAAVLVEDRLTEQDYAAFLAEAQRHGLDRGRAQLVLGELARDQRVAVPAVPVPAVSASRAAGWLEPLAKARAALRAGRPIEAHGWVVEAREWAGESLPPIRAVADEVEQVIFAAGVVWQQAVEALADRRLRAAGQLLDGLTRDAVDVPGPGGRCVTEELAVVRRRLASADEVVVAAVRTTGTDRERLLLRALEIVADHQVALDALAAARWNPAPIPAPTPVPTAADRLASATGLYLAGNLLRWIWPPGCTEMMVVWRQDAPARSADDPAAERRKVTNTRYELDGGVVVPGDRPLHIAVFGCVRGDGGRLLVASTCAPSARLWAVGG